MAQNTHKEAFQDPIQLKSYKLSIHSGHPLKKMKALSQNLFSDPVNPYFISANGRCSTHSTIILASSPSQTNSQLIKCEALNNQVQGSQKVAE
jgi:hypothetical protein